jgi:hypothetical protein
MVVTDDYKKIMNPSDFATIVRSIGLDFTTADKRPWDDKNSYCDLTETTFLKRSFIVHPRIGRWVAPLEKKSMTSTLNYVSDELRDLELTVVKLQNFQREAFLHFDVYNKYMIQLESFLHINLPNINVKFLSEKQLLKLYNDDEYGNLLTLN